MKIKYPNLWTEKNGLSFCDDNGEFTAIAKNWNGELTNLSGQQIRIGMTNLADRKNASFPPTALEFVAHCKEQGLQACADEIFDYINKPLDSDWWWKSVEAFNVYKQLYYNPSNNMPSGKVLEKIEKIYKKLNMRNLDPIPQKPVALPVKESRKIDFNRGRFQGYVFSAIMKIRPDLMGKVIIDDKGNKSAVTDTKVMEFFTPAKGNQLMQKYYSSGQPNMTDFLRNEGIAV